VKTFAVRGVASFVTVVAMLACDRTDDSGSSLEPDRWSDDALLAEGARYLGEPAFRRASLEASLTNPSNTYSRQRLTSYGLATRGWDLLPEFNPASVVVGPETAAALREGRPLDTSAPKPFWDGKRPTTMGGWVALGREVFFRYPLRAEIYVEWAIANPDAGARVGVRAVDDGSYPGAVLFVDNDGSTRIGMTCAICHADVEGGRAVVGQARRAFDYGALRLAYHDATKIPVDADLARRMRTWGPGRADVTEDDDEDPVAVPDLWGLRYQGFLTQAGTIRQASAAALAIRQETQLLTSNHEEIRPPRELAFALAMFLYSLKPAAPAATSAPPAMRGRAIFQGRCASCHANAAYGGDLVSAQLVETNAALANGAARGTHSYRTPALVRVRSAAPYFHDGSLRTLADVLSPARLDPGYRGGFLGPGPVSGHRYGLDLPEDEKSALLAYLQTL
jgi:cytochrome c5